MKNRSRVQASGRREEKASGFLLRGRRCLGVGQRWHLHATANVLNATAFQTFKQLVLCYVSLTSIKKRCHLMEMCSEEETSPESPTAGLQRLAKARPLSLGLPSLGQC